MVTSQLNIRPVFDVHADVQGRDLYGASRDIDENVEGEHPTGCVERHDGFLERPGRGHAPEKLPRPVHGHTGACHHFLVYLFLVMNFQSWIDPLIVLMAVPFCPGGSAVDAVPRRETPMSVPALMGTLMCIRD